MRALSGLLYYTHYRSSNPFYYSVEVAKMNGSSAGFLCIIPSLSIGDAVYTREIIIHIAANCAGFLHMSYCITVFMFRE